MLKTIPTYKEYLVNVINHTLETYGKRKKILKNMIVEVNSTSIEDEEKLDEIAEHLDYLISIIKKSSI
jgi:predicted N-formylglutamate amidohydrolase